MNFWERRENGLSQSLEYLEGGTWKWNSNGQSLELYIDDIIISALKPITERKVKIAQKYSNWDTLTTTEVTFVRRK